jgi:hypothetical protein
MNQVVKKFLTAVDHLKVEQERTASTQLYRHGADELAVSRTRT